MASYCRALIQRYDDTISLEETTGALSYGTLYWT
jgi:hypothetical protein